MLLFQRFKSSSVSGAGSGKKFLILADPHPQHFKSLFFKIGGTPCLFSGASPSCNITRAEQEQKLKTKPNIDTGQGSLHYHA
jgi:hypothetical protein